MKTIQRLRNWSCHFDLRLSKCIVQSSLCLDTYYSLVIFPCSHQGLQGKVFFFSVQSLYCAHIKKPDSLVPAIKPIISHFACIKLCVWNATYQTNVLVGPPLNKMFLCFIKAHTTTFLTAQSVNFVYYI